MKLSIKNNLLKVFALVLAVCAAVVVATMPSKSAKAEEANLSVTASIRLNEEGLTGIKYSATANDAWITEKAPSAMGILIYPNANEVNFDSEADAITNSADDKLDAVNFETTVGAFNYSLVFDRETILGFDGVTEDNIDAVMQGFYAKEFAARVYAVTSEGVVYSAPVVTSLRALAIDAKLAGEEVGDILAGSVTEQSVNAYVVKGEDAVVVAKGEVDLSSVATVLVGGKVAVADVVDGALVIDGSESYTGYQDVAVIDNAGNVVIYNVLFADKALTTAEEVEEAFDYGDQKLGANFVRNDSVYVLANDIDMASVTINNRMIPVGNSVDSYVDDGSGNYVVGSTTSTASDVGFGGIFDGMGHTISNVTVEMKNGPSVSYVDSIGASKTKTIQAFGFFANVQEGAIIKNVAFINVYGKGDGSNLNQYGLNGLLGVYMKGTLENVYFEASIDTIHARGPFAQYGDNATLKNVVVNFPKANYDIESHLESAAKAGGSGYYNTYAYGYGAMSGHNSPMNRNTTYENVMVVSPMPINLYKSAGSGYAGIGSVYYAENETELRVLTYNWTQKVEGVETPFSFTHEAGTTIEDAIAAETEAGSVRTYQIAGIRRYDNSTLAGADAEYTQALLATGLFKIAEGQITWHNQKPVIEVSEEVDFDATESKLLSTILADKTIVGAKVSGQELTVEEGKIVGVPELNNLNSADQLFAISIETEETIYSFTNVKYWAMIIDDQAELKAALDYDYSVDNLNNFGFYKLGGNINIDNTTWTNIDYSDLAKKLTNDAGTAVSTWNGIACGAGFAGIFDGAGYTIDFNKTIGSNYGLFGSFAYGAQVHTKQPVTVKNLALIDLGGTNWKPVLAQYTVPHTYGTGVLLENLYVTWEKNSIMSGLIYEPYAKGTTINNVVVDIEDNLHYGRASDAYADKAVYGNDISDKTLKANGYYGGTLFYSLRRGTSGFDTTVTNFISLGKGGLGKTYNNGTDLRNYFISVDNGDGTYTHTLRNGGWSAAVTGGAALRTEAYYLYAGNQEYGDQPIPTGMKAGFASIANNYAGAINSTTKVYTTAIPGYYCANCGNVFSLTEGNCTTCVVEEVPVALTASADLWKEPICFTWKTSKISEVTNANVGTTGEVVVAGASKYDTTAEMQAAYEANNDIFASFTGDAGNGLWDVVDGKLVWVGAAA